MGRNFLSPDILTKILKRPIFFTFLFIFSQKASKCFMSLLLQGGGSPGNFSFSAIGGVKNCLREGDCVLKGQPMGIPPLPPPLAHLCARGQACTRGQKIIGFNYM